jgi:hypothetical protein
MKIDVHTVVDKNSIPYYFYMIDNFKRLSSDSSTLSFLCYYLDSVDFDIDYFYKNGVDRFTRILSKSSVSSHAHSYGLSEAMKNMNSKNCNVFCDSDIVMLYNGWDKKLVNLFESDIGMIGTSYRSMKQHSHHENARKVQCYKDNPNTTWLAVEPGIFLGDLDLTPFNPARQIKIETEDHSKIFKLPLGYDLLTDIGWKIPCYIHDNDIKADFLININPTSESSKVLMYDEKVDSGVRYYNEEYQLSDGTPFLSHQRGSLRHKFKEDPHSKIFYQRCEEYIEGILNVE